MGCRAECQGHHQSYLTSPFLTQAEKQLELSPAFVSSILVLGCSWFLGALKAAPFLQFFLKDRFPLPCMTHSVISMTLISSTYSFVSPASTYSTLRNVPLSLKNSFPASYFVVSNVFVILLFGPLWFMWHGTDARFFEIALFFWTVCCLHLIRFSDQLSWLPAVAAYVSDPFLLSCCH